MLPCEAMNVSYGGICIRVSEPLESGSEAGLMIWSAAGSGMTGAVFLESDVGWLGPDEDRRSVERKT